ncbi:MAG: hypothetical protein LBH81_03300 [Rickettsiales bacterium]|nr:hypothetical protein [Rickettsiales bacterium]
MKRIIFGLIGGIASISGASAAGTYYNYGNYAASQASGNIARQSSYSPYQPQSSQQYTPGGQSGYQQPGYQMGGRNQAPKQSSGAPGLKVSAFAGYESADFGFEMKNTHSEINFNNINWIKFGADAAYMFDAGGTKIEVKGGFEVGTQGESGNVTDDDMSRGGIYIGEAYFETAPNVLYGNGGVATGFSMTQLVMGVGEQGQGSSLGAFASIGLGNGLKIGDSVVIKPSVGYRYESFKLVGQNMMTMAVQALVARDQYDINAMYDVADNCPGCQIVLFPGDGNAYFAGWVEGFDDYGEPFFLTLAEAAYLDGTTHEYNVSWSGPFIAADLEIKTAPHSAFTLRAELGLPAYTAEADQPYRSDWSHPVSIRDSAPIFGGMHYGLNMNYSAGVSDTMAVNLGWRWDYYTVDGADAETFYAGGGSSKMNSEVKARYKTSGIRAGLTAKF